jgi:hypothetical protein
MPLLRRAAILVLAALVLAPASALARKKRQDKGSKKPVVVAVDDADDPKEAHEEARRRAGDAPVTLTPASIGRSGPAGGAAHTLATAEGEAYRPRDVVVTNPAFDDFPSNSHTEPSIAAQGDAVVCVFNDGGNDPASAHPAPVRDSDGFSISADAGASFADQGKRAPVSPLTSFLGDNVVAAGADGDFFYVSDAGRNDALYTSIGVSRSTDGGHTWGMPSDAALSVPHRFGDGFFDKPWIAVDTSHASTRGNVYVTWSDFSFTGFATDLWTARSTDHGATFTAQRIGSFSHPVAVSYVQVAANGTVWIGEQDEGDVVDGRLTGTNSLRSSTDGGATWSASKTVGRYLTVGDATAQTLCGDPNFFGGLVRYLNGPIEADSSLRIAVDPSDTSGRTVFVVTHAIPPDRPDDASDVFLWRTTDGGATFSAPLRVNDDETTNDQFMPDLWVAPDGTLGVMWLDRRRDPANWRLEAWMAISRDHGASFGPSFPVSSAAFPPVGTCQMSDYNGVFADAARFALAWGDAREVDPQKQLVQQIRATTLPLAGPGPLLSLESFDVAPDRRSVLVRLQNDGLSAASGFFGVVSVEGDTLLAPIAVTPIPDIAGGHGTVTVAFPLVYAVSTPYVKAAVKVFGPGGSASLPFAFSRTAGADLGAKLSVSFEGATTDLAPESGSLWHVTTACAALDAGHSGAHVAYFGRDAGCDYDVQADGQPVRVFGGLVSRPVFLPRGSALLRFKEWVGIPARYRSDHAGLQISTDGGVSFENAWGYGKMSRTTPPTSLELTDSTGHPTWHPVELDLSDYTGHEVVLRFWFNGIGKASGGYAVDDVELFAIGEGSRAGLGTCEKPMRFGVDTPAYFATGAFGRPAGVTSVCDPDSFPNAFWLEFVPEKSGFYAIEPACSDAVLTVSSGPRCGPVEPLRCTAGGPSCAGPSELVGVSLPGRAGVPVRILVTSPTAISTSITARYLGSCAQSTFVPVLVDLQSRFGRYTSELSLTNLANVARNVALEYHATLGSGSGTAVVTIGPRRQLLVPDAFAFLRSKGLPIPGAASGQQAGTLHVVWEFDECDDDPRRVLENVRVLSTTAPPQPQGSAGVAFGSVLYGSVRSAVVPGLRASAMERSKVAVYNTSSGPRDVVVTAFSGDGDGGSAVAKALTLPPNGWAQIEDVLGGFSNGWATVECSDSGVGAYGVVNDAATNDGSFIPAFEDSSGHMLPVLVETDRYTSELILTNTGDAAATLTLRYVESLDGAGARGTISLTLPARTQRRIPDALQFLRDAGMPITARGRPHAGTLRVEPIAPGVFLAVRVVSPSPAGGAFGLFLHALNGLDVIHGSVLGLHADGTTRANVAVGNGGADGDGPVTLSLQALDGDTGLASGAPVVLTLEPGRWAQPEGFFTLRNGWVEVTRTAGSAPWFAYGVLNDGAWPGDRTGDGAYVPMSE